MASGGSEHIATTRMSGGGLLGSGAELEAPHAEGSTGAGGQGGSSAVETSATPGGDEGVKKSLASMFDQMVPLTL